MGSLATLRSKTDHVLTVIITQYLDLKLAVKEQFGVDILGSNNL